jgi:putative endonuclease
VALLRDLMPKHCKGFAIKDNWVVYIVRCKKNRALYTGITSNIERRLKEHNSKRGARYTRIFGPVKLLWTENHPDRSSALKRESQIKKFPPSKKRALFSKK